MLAYSDKLVDLTEAMTPYMPDLVKACLEIYAKDGKYYGAPLHVGAMDSFYDKGFWSRPASTTNISRLGTTGTMPA